MNWWKLPLLAYFALIVGANAAANPRGTVYWARMVNVGVGLGLAVCVLHA